MTISTDLSRNIWNQSWNDLSQAPVELDNTQLDLLQLGEESLQKIDHAALSSMAEPSETTSFNPQQLVVMREAAEELGLLRAPLNELPRLTNRWISAVSQRSVGTTANISGMLLWVMKENYKQDSKDVHAKAQKIQFFTVLREAITDALQRAREALARAIAEQQRREAAARAAAEAAAAAAAKEATRIMEATKAGGEGVRPATEEELEIMDPPAAGDVMFLESGTRLDVNDEGISVYEGDLDQGFDLVSHITAQQVTEQQNGAAIAALANTNTFILPDGSKIQMLLDRADDAAAKILSIDVLSGVDRVQVSWDENEERVLEFGQDRVQHDNLGDDGQVLALQANGQWAAHIDDGSFRDIDTDALNAAANELQTQGDLLALTAEQQAAARDFIAAGSTAATGLGLTMLDPEADEQQIKDLDPQASGTVFLMESGDRIDVSESGDVHIYSPDRDGAMQAAASILNNTTLVDHVSGRRTTLEDNSAFVLSDGTKITVDSQFGVDILSATQRAHAGGETHLDDKAEAAAPEVFEDRVHWDNLHADRGAQGSVLARTDDGTWAALNNDGLFYNTGDLQSVADVSDAQLMAARDRISMVASSLTGSGLEQIADTGDLDPPARGDVFQLQNGQRIDVQGENVFIYAPDEEGVVVLQGQLTADSFIPTEGGDPIALADDSTFILSDGSKINLEREESEGGLETACVHILSGAQHAVVNVAEGTSSIDADRETYDNTHLDTDGIGASAGTVFAIAQDGNWARMAENNAFYDLESNVTVQVGRQVLGASEDYIDSASIGTLGDGVRLVTGAEWNGLRPPANGTVFIFDDGHRVDVAGDNITIYEPGDGPGTYRLLSGDLPERPEGQSTFVFPDGSQMVVNDDGVELLSGSQRGLVGMGLGGDSGVGVDEDRADWHESNDALQGPIFALSPGGVWAHLANDGNFYVPMSEDAESEDLASAERRTAVRLGQVQMAAATRSIHTQATHATGFGAALEPDGHTVLLNSGLRIERLEDQSVVFYEPVEGTSDDRAMATVNSDGTITLGDESADWQIEDDSTLILADGSKVALQFEAGIVGMDVLSAQTRIHFGLDDDGVMHDYPIVFDDRVEWDNAHQDSARAGDVYAIQMRGEWAQLQDGFFRNLGRIGDDVSNATAGSVVNQQQWLAAQDNIVPQPQPEERPPVIEFVGQIFGMTPLFDDEGRPLIVSNNTEVITTVEGMEAHVAKLEGDLATSGEDAQLQNFDLQRLMQRQTESLKRMSSSLGLWHSVDQAVARNMGR